MASDFWAFLGISLVVIVTPGPDTALTIRNTLLGGRKGGVVSALGVATGQAIWALATSAGLAALLVASAPVFTAVKLLGATYLVYLGAQSLRCAFGRSASPTPAAMVGSPRRLAPRIAFRQGLVSNLGNPKMAVFFTSLLPQFAPRHDATFAALVSLGVVFCALTFAWLAGYAVVVARAGDYLRRPRIRRAIESVTGAVLIALGLRLAAEHR
ncbi:MAG TPA: LysE family translocator [Alphaproteobacteria bacterium]|nr:LysE family translocator [Alphaproteobacteria bacterium]